MPKHEHHKKENSEQKEEHSENRAEHVHAKKSNIWMHSTAILLIVLIIFVAFNYTSSKAGAFKTATECSTKAIDFLNTNLVSPGTTASLKDVKEVAGVYEITTSYQNASIPVYMSKDCEMLFVSFINTSKEIPSQESPAATEITKTARPVVELYVMSFCPYGVQAEQLMKPVVNLLGQKADFEVRFIASVAGNVTNSVQSLHGLEEAKEDLRQVCIMKYAPEKYWSYAMDINTNCYPNYRDSAVMDACWKNASTKLGINVSQIEACAYGSEGLELLKVDEALSNQNGVSGSPTIIINGALYSGARNSDAFKQAVCSAFITAPSECNQTLSATGQAASGNCG
jgi:predicted DsbA family dithiol-disulfide isomerase